MIALISRCWESPRTHVLRHQPRISPANRPLRGQQSGCYGHSLVHRCSRVQSVTSLIMGWDIIIFNASCSYCANNWVITSLWVLVSLCKNRTKANHKWPSQLTQARGSNTCALPGQAVRASPLSTPSPQSFRFHSGEEQGAFPFHSPHAGRPQWMPCSPVEQEAWAGKRADLYPAFQSTWRMCTCITSFLSRRSRDNPDTQRWMSLPRTVLDTSGDQKAFAE